MLSTIIYDAIARLIGHQAFNEVVRQSIISFGHHIIGTRDERHVSHIPHFNHRPADRAHTTRFNLDTYTSQT